MLPYFLKYGSIWNIPYLATPDHLGLSNSGFDHMLPYLGQYGRISGVRNGRYGMALFIGTFYRERV
jgi:hypothetical protein